MAQIHASSNLDSTALAICMTVKHKHFLIISDIEGSSLCRNYEMSSFMTDSWPEACLGMSLDVSAVVNALFNAGAESITIKDFHRTGYNIIPEYINPKARLVHGYKVGPVPGIGNPKPATAALMIGMHAPSGSGGFLAHTLTSRIARLEVNGELMSEAQLFSASLAPYGICPVFFSGCPVACHQALQHLEGISCYPINKAESEKNFDSDSWRHGLAKAAVDSLETQYYHPYLPKGPFHAAVTMRDGEPVAQVLAKRWKLKADGATIIINSKDIHQLYDKLMKLCYLTPLTQKIIHLGIHLFNARGKYGLWWVKQQLIKHPPQI